MKYSLFTLSLPECNPSEAARLIKEAGYDGIEWRCIDQADELPPTPDPWKSNRATLNVRHWSKLAVEFKKITSDNGLEVSNLATYCRADQFDEVKKSIEIAKAVGSPRLRLTAPPYDGKTPYPEIFKKTKEAYAHSAGLCKDAGLQGLLELHMGNIAPSASLGFRILDGLDPKHIGVIHDPGNMVIEGYENWKMGCELLGAYFAFCHAKNSRLRLSGTAESGAALWSYEPCEMNTGFVDWTAVMRAFKSVGYQGWISNEDHFSYHGKPALERIRYGLAHLKKCEALA